MVVEPSNKNHWLITKSKATLLVFNQQPESFGPFGLLVDTAPIIV